MYASPFTVPPSPELQIKAKAEVLPADFQGRAGVLLCRLTITGEERLLSALEPAPLEKHLKWNDLTPAMLWPALEEDRLPSSLLMTGKLKEIPIEAVLATIFAGYSNLPLDQGGAVWEKRKAQWRYAVARGLSSPTVVVLERFNRLRAAEPGKEWTLIGTAERWIGPSMPHEMKYDGTFVAPVTSVKYLINALLDGIPHEDDRPIVTADPALPVLFEDDAMIVIDKPARLASVPGVREAISAKSILEKTAGPLRVVHRLDTDTSGLLVFAKTLEAERILHESFRNGTVLKRYVARLEGVPDENSGSIDLPIALNSLDRPRQCVLSAQAGGKPSVTDWELIRIETPPDGRRKALVNLWPETGRTHQLRVHCAHAKGLDRPIDGDSFYDSQGILAEAGHTRLCLHAAALTFPHPTTGDVMTFETEPDFPIF